MSDINEESSGSLIEEDISQEERAKEHSDQESNADIVSDEEDMLDDVDEENAQKEELANFLRKFKRPNANKADKDKKRRKRVKNEFIDDEAELSGDDEVSEDELENSDDDQNDLDLVDREAPELDSEDEEKVRKLYQKQLETEDKRAVLLLQEQFEDNDVAIGQRRRRKFRWQAKEMMENSLRRHYDPDDDDSQDYDDDEDDDYDYDDINPRLRRPTAETLLLGSTKLVTRKNLDESPTASTSGIQTNKSLGIVTNDDSNSASIGSKPATSTGGRSQQPADMHRYLFRDKELVQALSTKETVVVSREVRDKNIQREVQRMIQSKSIFDSLYG